MKVGNIITSAIDVWILIFIENELGIWLNNVGDVIVSYGMDSIEYYKSKYNFIE